MVSMGWPTMTGTAAADGGAGGGGEAAGGRAVSIWISVFEMRCQIPNVCFRHFDTKASSGGKQPVTKPTLQMRADIS